MSAFPWRSAVFFIVMTGHAFAAAPPAPSSGAADPIAERWQAWGGNRAQLPIDIVGDGNVIMGRRKLWATHALPAPSPKMPFALQRIDRIGKERYHEEWTAHSGQVVLKRTFIQPKMRAFIPALAPSVEESRTFYLDGTPQSRTRYDRDGHIIHHQVFSPKGKPIVTKSHRLMELKVEVHDPTLRRALKTCPGGLERDFTGPSARRGLHPRWSEYDAPLRFYCGSDGVHDHGQELFVSPHGRIRAEREVQVQSGLMATRRINLKVLNPTGELFMQAKARWGMEGLGTCVGGEGAPRLTGPVAQDPVAPHISPTGAWRSTAEKEAPTTPADGGPDTPPAQVIGCFAEAERWMNRRTRPDGTLTPHLVP
jgi:hypothetical protein